MKLYTYTMERSLPRMALKGMPAGFPLYGEVGPAAEMAEQDSSPKDRAVVLEVDADGMDEVLIVSGERVEDVASMAQEDVDNDPEQDENTREAAAQEAYSKVYDKAENLSSTQEMLDEFDVVESNQVIHPSRIKVLGAPILEFPDDLEEEMKVTFEQKAMPLKAFSMPLVTRLLRSIFLPKHKLFGAGRRRGPSMGFVSRFLPKREEAELDEPPPDVVSGVPLVWAAGKTFRRGMRGAFGSSDGDAVGQLVAMRIGQEPGKYLGSGAKGAVYALGPGRVVKVTMDGNEIQAAANLIGVRHPNLSLVYDAFIVTDGEKGVGIIIRDAIDTTLNKFDKKVAVSLDKIMDDAFLSASEKIGNAQMMSDIDPNVLADEVSSAIGALRDAGCEVEESILLDLADAFRELRHLGILGIDFDSQNIGVVKKPIPRIVLFDYGMTKSPPVEVEVVSLKMMRR